MRNKPLLLAAAASALLAGCSPGHSEPENAQAPVENVALTPDQLRHIHLYTVTASAFTRTVKAPGTVDYDNDQSTTVVSPYGGAVTRVLVALGQRVGRGQPVAIVQSADYAAAAGAYRKAAVTARNARRVAAADRDLAAHDGIAARERPRRRPTPQAPRRTAIRRSRLSPRPAPIPARSGPSKPGDSRPAPER
jgi:cobalt-zinc-cadmium efflux system membrane fusion protein